VPLAAAPAGDAHPADGLEVLVVGVAGAVLVDPVVAGAVLVDPVVVVGGAIVVLSCRDPAEHAPAAIVRTRNRAPVSRLVSSFIDDKYRTES
jgi:hypothetical protein